MGRQTTKATKEEKKSKVSTTLLTAAETKQASILVQSHIVISIEIQLLVEVVLANWFFIADAQTRSFKNNKNEI